MTSRLQTEIRQSRGFAGVQEEAFLNLQRTASVLMQSFGAALKSVGVTPTQYNALRILRGARPEGLPCKEVGRRLVTPVPDVTRLLDRLEGRGLTARDRAVRDRRVVEVRIADAGLSLLRRAETTVGAWVEKEMNRLPKSDLRTLIALLERLRG